MDKLSEIAMEHDIPIVSWRFKGAEEAISLCQNGFSLIAIDPAKVKSHADYNVKCIHELGHCVTNSFYDPKCPIMPKGRVERHADIWAFTTMLPRHKIMAALKDGYTELWQLAEKFEVTESYMKKALQYYKLWRG